MKSSSYFSNIFTTLLMSVFNSYEDVSSTQNLFMFDTKANIFLCPQGTKLGNDQFKKSCEHLDAIEILPRQNRK